MTLLMRERDHRSQGCDFSGDARRTSHARSGPGTRDSGIGSTGLGTAGGTQPRHPRGRAGTAQPIVIIPGDAAPAENRRLALLCHATMSWRMCGKVNREPMIARSQTSTTPASPSTGTSPTRNCLARMACSWPRSRQVVRHLPGRTAFDTRSCSCRRGLYGLRDALDARGRLPVYVMPVERLAALVGSTMHRGALAIACGRVRPRAWRRGGRRPRVEARRGRERVANAGQSRDGCSAPLAFGRGGVLSARAAATRCIARRSGCRRARRSVPLCDRRAVAASLHMLRAAARASWP